MPYDGFKSINVKEDTKERVDALKEEMYGTENATFDETIRRLIREAGYDVEGGDAE